MNGSFGCLARPRFARVADWRLVAIPIHGRPSATCWKLGVLQPLLRLLPPGIRGSEDAIANIAAAGPQSAQTQIKLVQAVE